MQWLVSQGLFYAEVDLWDEDGIRKGLEEGAATTGSSSLALFWLLIIGFLSWVFVAILSIARRYPPGMPLLGACSAVIAASCHLPAGLQRQVDSDVTRRDISWGAVSEPVEDGPVGEKWLSLSTGDVERPITGKVYGR